MSTESNKAVVRHWVEAVINQDNMEALHETHAPNFVNHLLPAGAPQGIEGEAMLTRQFSTAFSEAHFDIESLVAEGDQVAMRYTYHGVHTGTFNGVPATGKSFSAGGINLLRLENDKIVENWLQFDLLGLLQQLGAIPAPQGA
jgi:steroid delta-isomerase-like uncharacterized protein